jgi:polyketide cyclase/dehydrase/lipid transport protein
MGRVAARVVAEGGPEAAEALWFDVRRWPSFVDGFGALRSVDDAWPRGGAIVWDSRPGGRGRVVERVVSHAPGRRHEADVDDEKMTGRQVVGFQPAGAGRTEVAVELRYELKDRYPWTPVLDLLFIRRAVGDSLRRTLRRFAIELEAERELAG